MDHKSSPPPGENHQITVFRGQKSLVTWVIEAIDVDSGVKLDPQRPYVELRICVIANKRLRELQTELCGRRDCGLDAEEEEDQEDVMTMYSFPILSQI